MTRYKFQSRSLADAQAFFEQFQDRVSTIRTKTNKISPYLLITFCSDLPMDKIKSILSSMNNGQRMLETLEKDDREVFMI